MKEEGGKVKKPYVIQGKNLTQDAQEILIIFCKELPFSEALGSLGSSMYAELLLILVTKDTFPLLDTTYTLYTNVLLLPQLSCDFKT